MDTKIVQGSSPRMRGTRVMQCDNRACGGIIPAYAGNTIQMRKAIFNNRDHPRVCGEHPWYLTSTPSGWRIIPAYAGNTCPHSDYVTPTRDHPRVCGEHVFGQLVCVRPLGSSPRMRGTRVHRLPERCRPGIIPAYAGNTRRMHRRDEANRDHPRVCGEHFMAFMQQDDASGSSPRMRGTPFRRHGEFRRTGIIPAYAGNTEARSTPACPKWDHPRVCGEHR